MPTQYFLDHSFPQMWKFGKLNRVIIDQIIADIEKKLPKDYFIFFIDTTWMEMNTDVILSKMSEQNLKKIVLFGFLDPSLLPSFVWMYKEIKDKSWPECNSLKDFFSLPDWIQKEITELHKIDLNQHNSLIAELSDLFGKNTVEIGYTNNLCGVRIDFFAIVMSDIFKNYDRENLIFSEKNIIPYLCYQFKPHKHRQYLTYRIKQENLLGKGIITLGDTKTDSKITLPGLLPIIDPNIDRVECSGDTGGQWLEAYGAHDPHSLGDKLTWQRSFLNIVSETIFYDEKLFVSEKIWKPIIGLRPFVIYGNPKLYPWLESIGFDTFEDLWPDINLRDSVNHREHCEKIIEIVKYVNDLSEQEIIKLYRKIFPRLEHNHDLFFNYAKQQQFKIENIVEELENFGFFDSI